VDETNKIPAMYLDFTILKGTYSIYRLKKDSAIPDWINDSEFYSLTRTQDELSIVCKHVDIIMDDKIKIDKYWRILKINGPLDLSLIGIIANIFNIFKENKISIFTISTYDTDYILIKNQHIDKALTVLKNNGHKIFIAK
jgi:hypothetical protein